MGEIHALEKKVSEEYALDLSVIKLQEGGSMLLLYLILMDGNHSL